MSNLPHLLTGAYHAAVESLNYFADWSIHRYAHQMTKTGESVENNRLIEST